MCIRDRFYDAFGDVKAKQMVDECMVAMRSVLNQYGGRVVKTIGDELMCVLQDAQKACLAATDMQLKITSLPVVEGQQRAIRIGFHAGMVIHQDNDVFGDTVNLAARMTGLAKGGQIMTTAATVLQLPNLLRSSTRKIAALSIKGKEDDIEVCEVIWQAGDELTMATPSTFQANRLMQLSLTFHGEHCVMGSSFTRLEMGRDATCHFAVSDKKASARQHGVGRKNAVGSKCRRFFQRQKAAQPAGTRIHVRFCALFGISIGCQRSCGNALWRDRIP